MAKVVIQAIAGLQCLAQQGCGEAIDRHNLLQQGLQAVSAVQAAPQCLAQDPHVLGLARAHPAGQALGDDGVLLGLFEQVVCGLQITHDAASAC